MRILLTGASSELGKRLYRRLKAEPRLADAVFVLLSHSKPVEAAAGDEIIKSSLLELSALPGFDAVLHLAGLSHSMEIGQYARINVEGTKRLLETLKASKLRQFVYLSSRCLGRDGGAYSFSKSMAEEAIRASGLPWTLFRPAEIIGEQYGRGITQFVEMARKWRIFPVVLSTVSPTLAPVGVDDAVEAIARSVLNPQCIGKAYTLAGPRDYRFAEVWRLLNERLSPGVLPLPVPAFLLRAVSYVNAVCPIFGSLAPDQIERLLAAKSSDSAAAIRDLGFKSRPLEELLL